jgi:protein-S-isoprenylcysteine O-methyltransferase Ste14
MSLSVERGPRSLLKFVVDRVKSDLQFSNIFTVDLVSSAAYAAATVYLLHQTTLPPSHMIVLGALAWIYVLLHVGKLLLVIYLERKGGDAREFVGSEKLVTSGVYAYTRNPVYLISIIQSVVWSVLLAALAEAGISAWIGYVLAIILLYAHFWGMDRLIVPHEEAALNRAHPVEFPAYCARTPRWFGPI